MQSLSMYEGAMLAISGKEDALVLYFHAKEIASACKGKMCEYKIIDNADHILNVLGKHKSMAEKVIKDTADWIAANI